MTQAQIQKQNHYKNLTQVKLRLHDSPPPSSLESLQSFLKLTLKTQASQIVQALMATQGVLAPHKFPRDYKKAKALGSLTRLYLMKAWLFHQKQRHGLMLQRLPSYICITALKSSWSVVPHACLKKRRILGGSQLSRL